MSDDRARLETFWRERYEALQRSDDGTVATWLDYSSDQTRGQRLQAQTQALVLEAIGTLRDQRLLDLGCGWGMLTLAMAAFGARAVGLDILESAITTLQAKHPNVDWVVGNFLDPVVRSSLGRFDRVIAVESFQCAGPPTESLRAAWAMVAPGGRLVAIMPNAACPIVQRVVAANADNYFATTAEDIKDTLETLPGVERFAMRGLSFASDQWIAPYEVSGWAQDASAWPTANRLMIISARSSDP